MYHMFTIGDIAISMVWLGVIVFIITLSWVVWWKASKNNQLNFDSFFPRLPFIILCSYLAWSRSWHVINQLILFPTSFEQVLLYFSPSGRNFSLLWLILWWIAGFLSFLRKQPQQHHTLRIDIFFEAVCIWMIPLWVFLVLWDSFIGMPTQWILWVSAIQADSKLALYNSVLPLWFGVSLIGMIGYWISAVWRHTRRSGYWYIWFAILSVLIGTLTIYQNYARRIITMIGDTRLDIKQYVLAVVALLFVVARYRSKEKQPYE